MSVFVCGRSCVQSADRPQNTNFLRLIYAYLNDYFFDKSLKNESLNTHNFVKIIFRHQCLSQGTYDCHLSQNVNFMTNAAFKVT